jgi:hypothetical protein
MNASNGPEMKSNSSPCSSYGMENTSRKKNDVVSKLKKSFNVLQLTNETLNEELSKCVNLQDWNEHELTLANNIIQNL